MATIDLEGRRRRASTLLRPEVRVGDWVLVAAGSVVEVLDPDEARLIRRTLREALALDMAEERRTLERSEERELEVIGAAAAATGVATIAGGA